jgi:photosystem II stability/assembly factor-like uncharacterized protein
MRIIVSLLSLSTIVFARWTAIGPAGGPIYSGGISRTNPPVVYFSPYASPTKLLKSTDAGITWEFTNGTLSTYPREIVVHPQNPDIVYALTGSAIYKTTNGGSSWTINSVPASHYFYAFTINPLNPDELFAAGYNYTGGSARLAFARSTNAGVNWTTTICDTTPSSYGYSIAVDPVDTSVIYVGGYRSAGGTTTLYRSFDRGETWEEINLAINGYYPYALHINPTNNNIILIAPYASGIYRSTDRGATWTRTAIITSVYRIASAASQPATVYATNSSGIYKSTDAGITWTRIGTSVLGKPNYCLLTNPVNPGTVYFGTTVGFYRSTDYGITWENTTNTISFNKTTVISLASDNATVYTECLDNAIYRSTDNGASWERCPEFLSCGNICAIAVHPSDPQTVWALEGSG